MARPTRSACPGYSFTPYTLGQRDGGRQVRCRRCRNTSPAAAKPASANVVGSGTATAEYVSDSVRAVVSKCQPKLPPTGLLKPVVSKTVAAFSAASAVGPAY